MTHRFARRFAPILHLPLTSSLVLLAGFSPISSAWAQAPAAPATPVAPTAPDKPPLQATTFLLKPTDLLAICGDSITEQKQYSVYMEDYLLACQPGGTKGIQSMQAGWSGEVVPGFLGRMDRSVLPMMPTAATTCYGMNDGHYTATSPGIVSTYRQALVGVVQGFKKKGVGTIVVGTPGVVDTNSFNRQGTTADIYNVALGTLGDAAKSVAGQEGVYFADVHSVMMDAMGKAKAKFGPKYQVAGGDGVHPGANGHLVMAYAYLKALGCDGDLGTIAYDMTGDTGTAAGGHTLDTCKKGELHLTSTRYPFCFFGTPGESNGTKDIVQFFPFNQDLNRLTLQVHNSTSKRIKVTWGSESHVYDAAQLDAGVNLAADFVNNPFVPAFFKLDGLVRAQQQSDTNITKTDLMALGQIEQDLPDQLPAIGALRTALVAKERKLIATTSAAVPPVSHVLKIEAATEADVAPAAAAPAG